MGNFIYPTFPKSTKLHMRTNMVRKISLPYSRVYYCTLSSLHRGNQVHIRTVHIIIHGSLGHDSLWMTLSITNLVTEALTDSEISLLKRGLPYNMNVDSAPFRQQLQSSLRHALDRGRDGALAKLKTVQCHLTPCPHDVASFIG